MGTPAEELATDEHGCTQIKQEDCSSKEELSVFNNRSCLIRVDPCSSVANSASLHEPVDAAAVRRDDQEVQLALLVLAETQDRLLRILDGPVRHHPLRLLVVLQRP